MRIPARSRALTATIVAAAFLGGCHDLNQYCDWGGLHRAESAQSPRVKVKSRKTVVARVTQPRTVAAGARIRQFCGHRHILFQTGRLRESTQEKARNDVLCSQS